MKGNLPSLEIVTSHGSGKSSKRKLTLTKLDVVWQVNIRGSYLGNKILYVFD